MIREPADKATVIGSRFSSTGKPRARTSLKFANAVTEDYTVPGAIEQVCESILSSLGTNSADLCILFAGGPGHEGIGKLLPTIHRMLAPSVLVGCSGTGVIGGGKEIESGTPLTLIAANSASSDIKAFAFEDRHSNGKDASPEKLVEATGIDPAEYEQSAMLVMVDPLTVATDNALSTLDSAYPHSMKFGGLVGGGIEYGDNAIFIGDRILRKGAVGLMLGKSFNQEIIVSGNEVPIGDPMSISVSNRNVILRFEERGPDGITPLDVLRKIQSEAGTRTKHLLAQTLIAGIESDRTAYASSGEFDFVMRNIMGIDDATGAMAIGDLVEEGQTFQFHVRDPLLAAADLEDSLNARVRTSENGVPPTPDVALCFNSVTRGTRLHETPNHDVGLISSHLNGAPAAGFFCNGEIVSKIGGFLENEFVTKVMGYTHSVVLLSSDHGTPEEAEPAYAQGNAITMTDDQKPASQMSLNL